MGTPHRTKIYVLQNPIGSAHAREYNSSLFTIYDCSSICNYIKMEGRKRLATRLFHSGKLDSKWRIGNWNRDTIQEYIHYFIFLFSTETGEMQD